MSITPLAALPSRARPATFSDEADTFFSSLPLFVSEVNALAVQYEADAAILATNTPGVLASANFKGYWSALAGSLNVPASVYHEGEYWLLRSNLADVTAKVPGVDPEWLALGAIGGYVESSGLVWPGSYRINTTTAPVTLTLPATPREGDFYTFLDVGGAWETNNLTLNRSGKNIMGTAENLVVNISNLQFSLWYNGTEWRLI